MPGMVRTAAPIIGEEERVARSSNVVRLLVPSKSTKHVLSLLKAVVLKATAATRIHIHHERMVRRRGDYSLQYAAMSFCTVLLKAWRTFCSLLLLIDISSFRILKKKRFARHIAGEKSSAKHVPTA